MGCSGLRRGPWHWALSQLRPLAFDFPGLCKRPHGSGAGFLDPQVPQHHSTTPGLGCSCCTLTA